MRQIKFRAWNKCTESYDELKSIHWDNGVIVSISILENRFIETTPVTSYELEQFTDLKDKNGIEVYTGDIVRYDNGELWLVKWHKPSASFLLFQIIENGANQILSGMANNINAHELEVISNVHDSKFLKLSNSRELE